MLRRDSLLVSSNQRKQMATKLTDDFAVEVLSQLLFKAFCRFKCVCKAWLAFSSDPHYCQKLLKFPLVLCTIAALLLMEELMELLIYRHSTSSFVLLTGLIAKSFFLVQEQSYCCRHFQLHCGDKFYCRTKLSFDHGSHTSTSTSTFSTKHPDSTDPEPDI